MIEELSRHSNGDMDKFIVASGAKKIFLHWLAIYDDFDVSNDEVFEKQCKNQILYPILKKMNFINPHEKKFDEENHSCYIDKKGVGISKENWAAVVADLKSYRKWVCVNFFFCFV